MTAPVARKHGLGYLVATVVLGSLGVAKLMRFVPRPLGILLFLAQLPNLSGVPWPVYPLVSIVILTVITVAAGIAVPTVGDKGGLPALTDAHVWDASAVAALDAVEHKYAQRGKQVQIIGLSQPSAHLHERLTGELTAGY